MQRSGALAPAPSLSPALWLTLFALAALLAWDQTRLDLVLAQLVGGPGGFALRDNWLLENVLHDGARRASWVLVVALCLGVWWPVGPLARIDFSARLQLAATSLAAAFAVSLLKGFSDTSCPWDLAGFGGAARYVPHWMFIADGGPGHCFPAGHASSGFAFIGGYFAFRDTDLRLARIWLAAALGAGLLLGLAQQLRGAHFMSHTLWTGWICWLVALMLDQMWPRHLEEQP
jgi:membrane-associated PAP2 superfamily phosphatase